jgi:L-ascorbate metabolism protein UlaG (beta-lactamase superfamily)
MDPEEAVKAHLDLGADRTIAMHFGTFQLTDEGIDDPVNDLRSALKKLSVSEEKFLVLDQGQAASY